MKFLTTKMSSKGQIVVPQEIREKLKLEEGDTLALFEEQELLVLRKISGPYLKQDSMIADKIKKVFAGNTDNKSYIH